MATTTITGLPTVTSLASATDYLVAVSSGVTSKITPDDAGLVERGHPNPAGGTMVGLPGVSATATTTFAVTTDTIYYYPILVLDAITVDAVLCEVTSGAGTVARMGILSANTAWQPTAVVQDAGTVDPSTNAVKTASFTAIGLTAGRYLLAFVANGAATIRLIQGVGPASSLVSTIGANPHVLRFSKASVGTGALSAANVWDTATGGSGAFQWGAFLRLTGA